MAFFYVVVLKQNRFLISKKEWIENPIINEFTKVFYSKNDNVCANFQNEPEYFLNKNIDAWYECFVVKRFESLQAAVKYISWKRPIFPVDYADDENERRRPMIHRFEEPTQVAEIAILESSSEENMVSNNVWLCHHFMQFHQIDFYFDVNMYTFFYTE